jgi:lipoteichoic acid synthase
MFNIMKSGRDILAFFRGLYSKAGDFFRNNEQIRRIRNSGIVGILSGFIREYWLLCFYIMLLIYMELLYRAWIFRDMTFDYFFALIFAVSGGTAIYILVNIFPLKHIKKASAAATLIITLVYGLQLIYYCIFRTPFSLISLGAAGDVVQFWDIAAEALLKNAFAVVLLLLPFVVQLAYGKYLVHNTRKHTEMSIVLAFCIVSYSFSAACVAMTGDGPTSQNTIYFDVFSPELSVDRLGVFTTVRLDVERLAVSTLQDAVADNKLAEQSGGKDSAKGPGADGAVTDPQNSGGDGTGITGPADNAQNQSGEGIGEQGTGQPEGNDPAVPDEPAEPVKPYNVMDIDFESLLAAAGEDDPLYSMHKYFSSVEPTATNEYTGMFKGCNLIMFTAEGFSPYAVSPELTPTLYKMINEGFVFKNFYNPVWWVSTSDGEYVACTGLIPKSGVWSMAKSGSNYMPFAMGNQFRKLGYTTKAYHNHTYTYYKRDVSHPNLGYDYKGVGNGLEVKKTWPESDLEMIDVTFDEYADQQPFHAYYMTVSGHMNYNFYGNQMASKNKKYVEDLPYSDEAKAYIACNLELEFAMKSLMEKLEAAGIAENTVIVLSPDHYPYGLERDKLNELAGHELESNFELYRSTLIIYKKGMEPVVVEKPCASLDIIPTVSNLFGLDYDSRLLMGRDILSSAPPLVIFSNRSWITDRAMYNSQKNNVTFLDGTEEDKEYVNSINRIVANKFKYSTKILETDYYGKVLKKDE